MTDIVDRATRSLMMARIKSKNTKPELLIRSLLHKKGFRFRIHANKLPGRPDIIFPKFKAIIFINGCFWHGHKNCPLFRLPKTRVEFWENKIHRNQKNDEKNIKTLLNSNWRVAIVWECSIRGKNKDPAYVINKLTDWITSSNTFLEISGNAK
jgi:DNA mismatch endonuclease (patch repair protein)